MQHERNTARFVLTTSPTRRRQERQGIVCLHRERARLQLRPENEAKWTSIGQCKICFTRGRERELDQCGSVEGCCWDQPCCKVAEHFSCLRKIASRLSASNAFTKERRVTYVRPKPLSNFGVRNAESASAQYCSVIAVGISLDSGVQIRVQIGCKQKR